MATHVTDYKKTSLQIALDLINHDNSTAFTAEQVDLVVDEPASSGTGKRTTVDVTSRIGSGYVGALKVTYNRVDLTDIPQITDVTDNEVEYDVVFVNDILGMLNTRYGLNIQPDDVTAAVDNGEGTVWEGVDEVPEPAFDQVLTYTVTALPSSFVWQGEISFGVMRIRQGLKSIWQVDVLDGLMAPEALIKWPENTPVMVDETGAVRSRPDGSVKIMAV